MNKLRKLLSVMLAVVLVGSSVSAFACTSFLVTKGASKDGSTMITYAADSHTLYGELYYRAAKTYPAGTMLQIVDWDSGKKLIKIPQIAQTYTTVGNSNEWGLSITETTYGGRAELEDSTGGIDYGTLIYLTLQRAKNAREAIKQMAELVDTYGYFSSGESFSIADANEVWILEMIGKGYPVLDNKGKTHKDWKQGAVWVAMRIPDGYISGHANHARITQFPQEVKKSFTSISSKNLKEIFRPEVEVVYSHDVVSFARLKGYYNGTDKDFSFSDTYAPITFSAARGCEARVYAGFLRCDKSIVKYEDYAMGHNLKNRMPLWIKPENKLSVRDVMELMRDHYQGTPMDMTKDLGAGPHACPYRWRPMGFEVNGVSYVNERAISTQQTGFSLVAQSRSWMPEGAKGILWFGVDDTYSTVYVPMYTNITRAPENFREGNGDMVNYSETSAFWLFNQVTNFAYLRYDDIIVDVRKVQKELEEGFIRDVAEFDNKLKSVSPDQMRNDITKFSIAKSEQTFKTWKKLSQYLLVKYIDGNVKKEKDGRFMESPYRQGQNVFPDQKPYRAKWLEMIVKDHGEILKVPAGATKGH
ncbi:MAG: C69 family dipeptidase [Bacteroidales bacterium]|nr:C69 family dipeptidase [Bacteroidales bacterium]